MRILQLAVVLVLTFGAAARGQEDGAGAPRLAIEPAEHDFGQVLDGQKAKTVFRIANGGSTELVIGEVRASCGCTVPIPEPRRIPAGGEGTLSVEFDSTGRSGMWHGSIAVYTNDPATPVTNLRLKAEVVPEVKLSTTYVYFGEVFRGDAQSREVVLENLRYEKLTLDKYNVEGEHFSCELAENGGEKPGGRYVFRVSIDPGAPYGYVEGNLFVHTSFARAPFFRIFLIARVKGYVDPSKPRVDFGILVRGPSLSGRQEKLEVASLRETIEIHSAETDLDFLRVEYRTLEPGRKFEVLLTIPDGDAPGRGAEKFPARVQGTLRIATSSVERPVIEVPVQMIVKTEE